MPSMTWPGRSTSRPVLAGRTFGHSHRVVGSVGRPSRWVAAPSDAPRLRPAVGRIPGCVSLLDTVVRPDKFV